MGPSRPPLPRPPPPRPRVRLTPSPRPPPCLPPGGPWALRGVYPLPVLELPVGRVDRVSLGPGAAPWQSDVCVYWRAYQPPLLPPPLLPHLPHRCVSRAPPAPCVHVCAVLGRADSVLRTGQLLEAYDGHPSQQKWCEATVVDESPLEVKLHFKVCSSVPLRCALGCALACAVGWAAPVAAAPLHACRADA